MLSRSIVRRALVAGVLFAPLFAAAPAAAAPPGFSDSIFWSSRASGAYGANALDDGHSVGVGPLNGTLTGVAFDLRHSRLYLGAPSLNGVLELSSNGGLPVIDGQSADDPEGIAVDPDNDRLYWADYTGKIGMSRLDGSQASVFASAQSGLRAFAVTIDVEGQRLFWSTDDSIYSRSLDGTGPVTSFPTGAPGQLITGLAISGSKLYWLDGIAGTVTSANLDGPSQASILPSTGATLTGAFGVAIDTDAGRLYAGQGIGGSINFVNLDGTGGGQLLTAPPSIADPNYPTILQRPSASAPPVVSRNGAGTLHCSEGQWRSDDLGAFRYRRAATFSYTWQRDGADVNGATDADLDSEEPGLYRCSVTATNLAGDTSATSDTLAIDAPASPTETTASPRPAASVSAPAATPPVLGRRPFATSFFIVPPHFGVLPRGSRSSARRVRFTVSDAALVTLRVQQRRGGRWRTIRTIVRRVTAGSHALRFSGRIRPRDRGRALRPGPYRLQFSAAGVAGDHSPATVRAFRITR